MSINNKYLRFFNEYKNLFIISSFVLFSILSTFLLVRSHFLGAGGDTYFHWQRLMELKSSFNNHHFFPTVALNEYNNSGGSAVMAFYPYQTLLPMVLLSYVFKSGINLIYFSFSLYTFFALIISYYSCLHINHRIDTSYLFSIMYGLSTYMITHGFQSMDLGILFSTISLPLIVFGFIDFIENSHWINLSLGLTLIIFSHILNAFFAFIFLVIWFLINIKKIDYNKIISLVKCILLTLITTAVFYLPFLKLIILNDFSKPFPFPLNGQGFIEIINGAFNNDIGDHPGLFTILGAILIPILFYRKFNSIIKQMYWISIVIILICSNIFPWSLLQSSFIQFIQFPWRLYFIPQLLLTYIFSLGVTKYLNKKVIKQRTFIIMILFTLLMQIGAQTQIVNRRKDNPDLNNHAQVFSTMLNNGDFKMSNAEQVNNLSYGFSSNDYYPEQSLNFIDAINKAQGINKDNNHLVQFSSLGDGNLNFNNKKNIKELYIPFVIYQGIKYKIYLDGNLIPLQGSNSLLTLNNVKHGNHHVQIKVIPGISDIIIRILFFIGIAIYIWLFFWNLYGKNKINIIPSYKKHNS